MRYSNGERLVALANVRMKWLRDWRDISMKSSSFQSRAQSCSMLLMTEPTRSRAAEFVDLDSW